MCTETHKVDICSSMNFANHDAWWKCYKQKLKEEGISIFNICIQNYSV